MTEDQSSYLANEAELFEEDAAVRRAMDLVTRAAAEVIIDLQDKGALYQYVASVRQEAVEAMIKLADADPTNTAAIIEYQAQIRLYFNACEFIRRTIDEGREVAEMIDQTKEFHADGSFDQ